MKIVVLGGTRFIGLHAVLLAVKRGHEVTVLHRGIHKANLPSEVIEVAVNRDKPDELSAALSGLGEIDVAIDTFAMTETQANSVVGALNGKISRVVVISSQDVYAQFGKLNGHAAPDVEALVNENSPLTVRYPFRGIAEHDGGEEYDKKDVESVFRKACGEVFAGVTVLRLPGVFGARDHQKRFCEFIDYLAAGNHQVPCVNGASWRWTTGHVQNVAHAIISAAERPLDGFHILNVGDATTLTMKERVEKIAHCMGVRCEFVESKEVPKSLGLLGRMPNDFVVDTSKIRSVLGFKEIINDDAAYGDLVEWYMKNKNETR